MPARSGRKWRLGNGGQSLVEFALVLPILTFLFLGATDLTRAFYYYIALQNATRETARVLIDYPAEYDDQTACTAGHQAAQPFLNITCAAGSIVISPAADTSQNPPHRVPGRKPVTVTATYSFTPITFLIKDLVGGTLTLKAATTMLTWY